jgi:hypothetical protein
MEFYRDATESVLRTALAPGTHGYVVLTKRAWVRWRRWLPIPVRKTVAELWPVKSTGATTGETSIRVTFAPSPDA